MNGLNIADVLGLIFLGIGMLDGFRRGLVKKGTSLVITLVTLFAVYLVSPYVETFFQGILPVSLLPEKITGTNSELYQMLLLSGLGEMAENYVHILAARVLALVSTYIVVRLLLRTLFFSLGVLTKVPGLSFLNRIAGAGLGLVQQLILLWMLFLVIAIFSGSSWGTALDQCIKASTCMSVLYENNLLFLVAILLILKV
jgi:uncharacterized membrane protein required for colicin V production